MSDKKGIKYFGVIGLIIGLLALTTAVFQGDLRAAFKPANDDSLKFLAIKAGKSLIKRKVLGQQQPDVLERVANDTHDMIQIIYMALGLLAIIFGIISWLNKEHIRMSGVVISLGLVAIAWQYVIIAVIIAILILIISNLG